MSEQTPHQPQQSETLAQQYAHEEAGLFDRVYLSNDIARATERLVGVFVSAPVSYHSSSEGLQESLESISEVNHSLALRHKNALGIFNGRASGQVVDALQPPQFFKDAFNAETGREMVDRVLESSLDTPDAVGKVLNFYQWQKSMLERRKEAYESVVLPKMLTDFQKLLNTGVRAGYLPKSLLGKFKGLVDQGQIAAVETMHHVARSSEESDSFGYCVTFRDGSVFIAQTLARVSGSPEAAHNFTHELLHGLEGVDSAQIGEHANAYSREAKGLGRVFGCGPLGVAINEAVIEHTADSLIHGKFSIITPSADERSNSGSYIMERSLLSTLCYGGTRTVNIQHFIAAAFEDGEVSKGSAKIKLCRELEKAFPGMNIVDQIKDFTIPEDVHPDTVMIDFANAIFTEAQAQMSTGRRLLSRVGLG